MLFDGGRRSSSSADPLGLVYRLSSRPQIGIVFHRINRYNFHIQIPTVSSRISFYHFEVECYMSLRADQRDYKNAFKKHYHAYSNWQGTGSNLSRRLILAYCVECGLKYEVMKQECLIQTTDAQGEVKTALGQHDLRKLLKLSRNRIRVKERDGKSETGKGRESQSYQGKQRTSMRRPPRRGRALSSSTRTAARGSSGGFLYS